MSYFRSVVNLRPSLFGALRLICSAYYFTVIPLSKRMRLITRFCSSYSSIFMFLSRSSSQYCWDYCGINSCIGCALYHHPHRRLCCHRLLHCTSFQPPTHNCYSCCATNLCHFHCRHNKLSTARWLAGLPSSSSRSVPSPIVPLPTTGDDYQT